MWKWLFIRRDGNEAETLDIALNVTSQTLDPIINAVTLTSDTTRLMLRSLVTTDADFNPVPMLRDSIDISEDNKIYTFHLMGVIYFYDGNETLAADVIAP